MSLAIIPGSFDPMTMGHLDIVRYAAEHYDEVVVAVMINPDKHYWFDTATRAEIARLSVAELPNVRVIEDRGMLIDLFDRLDADVVCKGWRNDIDYEYEMRMAKWNREHNPRFQTELIRATGDHAALSSTEVRNKLETQEDIAGLVHPRAVSLIMKTIERRTQQ